MGAPNPPTDEILDIIREWYRQGVPGHGARETARRILEQTGREVHHASVIRWSLLDDEDRARLAERRDREGLAAAADPTRADDFPDVSVDDCLIARAYEYDDAEDVYYTTVPSAPNGRIRTPGDLHRWILRRYSRDGGGWTINQLRTKLGWRRSWVEQYLQAHEHTHDTEPHSREEIAARDLDALVHDDLELKRRALAERSAREQERAEQEAARRWFTLEDHIRRALAKVEQWAPTYKPARLRLRQAADPWAAWCAPADVHFGKEASDRAAPQRWSRAHTVEMVETLTGETITELSLRGAPERVVLQFIGDWFHADTPGATTTKGTPQDVDGCLADVFDGGMDLAVRFVDLWRQLGATVQIQVVPGNHDSALSLALRWGLAAWFHSADDVRVSASTMPVQAAIYGASFLGATHGKTLRMGDLPAALPRKFPGAWGRCRHHYAVVGDLHHVKTAAQEFIEADVMGMTVLQQASICPPDRWHAERPFDAARGFGAYALDRERGLRTSVFLSPPAMQESSEAAATADGWDAA